MDQAVLRRELDCVRTDLGERRRVAGDVAMGGRDKTSCRVEVLRVAGEEPAVDLRLERRTELALGPELVIATGDPLLVREGNVRIGQEIIRDRDPGIERGFVSRQGIVPIKTAAVGVLVVRLSRSSEGAAPFAVQPCSRGGGTLPIKVLTRARARVLSLAGVR